MKKTEVKTIIKHLISTKIIGIGTTAICFKMNSGNVLKLYLNTPLKQELFRCYNMRYHLAKISEIGNSTFIVPGKLLFKNNICIEYISV